MNATNIKDTRDNAETNYQQAQQTKSLQYVKLKHPCLRHHQDPPLTARQHQTLWRQDKNMSMSICYRI